MSNQGFLFPTVYIAVYIEVLFFNLVFLDLQYRRWCDISQDGDSVAWDGGVSFMVGFTSACRWSLMPCG